MADHPTAARAAGKGTPRGHTPLFRERAVAARRQRWFGPARVAMPPSAAFAIGAATLAIGLLGAAVVSIEIPDRVRTYGVLLPPEGLLKVKAPRAGRVEYLPVANGDSVTPGQVILRLSGGQRAPGREPEPAARVASLNRELRMLEEATERQAELAAAREGLNRRRLELTGERIGAARAEARLREEQAVIAAARADRVRQLAAAHAVAEDAVAESAAAVLLSRAANLAARQRVLALQDERLSIEQQLARDGESLAAMRREAGARREAILRQIAVSELQSALEITAPGGGIVSGLAVRPGEDVAAGDVVMTLYAPQSRLEARLFLSPDNAGMVAVGQSVELQLKAYPHQFFGTRTAVVTAISTVALPPAEIDTDVPLTGPAFVVRARLMHAAIEAGGRRWLLPPGTSFEADIVRARWPLYRWLLRSVSGDPVRS
ncbi:MAG TPA: HlyD family efflux transporter periplasmic adaptor subunit [Woeseiaceae bacterium]|nr:HlyD family efflux transporter periplasmic adaptor subunit [Woeseiaceae bacterium]